MKVLCRFFCFVVVMLIGTAAVPYVTHAELYKRQTTGKGDETGLPLPRFVSLRSNEVYLRSGPGTRYPVRWVYKRQNLPVEVIQEFDTWRKIRDQDGAEGWVHQTLLTGRRHAVIIADADVKAFKSADEDARATMRLENGAIGKITSCAEKWCELSASGYKGWVEKKYIWGIYEDERIN